MATTEVTPAGVSSLGTLKACIAPTVASLAAPTIAEITAGVNFTFYVPGQALPVGLDQNVGQDVRLGSVQVYDLLGQQHVTLEQLNYIFDPQTPGSSNPAATFTDGYVGVLILRYGILATTDWAASQKVKCSPVKLGGRIESKTSDDEFGLWMYTQKAVITGVGNVSGVVAA